MIRWLVRVLCRYYPWGWMRDMCDVWMVFVVFCSLGYWLGFSFNLLAVPLVVGWLFLWFSFAITLIKIVLGEGRAGPDACNGDV